MATSHSFTATESDHEPDERARAKEAASEKAAAPARSARASWWILPVVLSGAGLWALVIKLILL